MLLESLSPALSADTHDEEIVPAGSSLAMPQSSGVLPADSPAEVHAQEIVKSPQGLSIFKKWLQRKNTKGPASHKPDRRSGKSRESVDRRATSHSPAREDDRHEEPSWMAAGRPKTVSAVP